MYAHTHPRRRLDLTPLQQALQWILHTQKLYAVCLYLSHGGRGYPTRRSYLIHVVFYGAPPAIPLPGYPHTLYTRPMFSGRYGTSTLYLSSCACTPSTTVSWRCSRIEKSSRPSSLRSSKSPYGLASPLGRQMPPEAIPVGSRLLSHILHKKRRPCFASPSPIS